MEWYYRITITYITQSGRLPDERMNTGATTSTLCVSIVFIVVFSFYLFMLLTIHVLFVTASDIDPCFHITLGFDPADAVELMHGINRVVLDCLNDCGEIERTVLPSI